MEFIFRTLYIAVGMLVGYQFAFTQSVKQLDLATMQEIQEQARFSFMLGVMELQQCTYLKKHYPKEYEQLIPLEYVVKLDFGALDLRGACASTNTSVNRIRLYPIVYDRHFKGCYNDKWNILYAHEMLHVIGLPPHQEYDTYHDYMLNDPIEDVIANCYGLTKE